MPFAQSGIAIHVKGIVEVLGNNLCFPPRGLSVAETSLGGVVCVTETKVMHCCSLHGVTLQHPGVGLTGRPLANVLVPLIAMEGGKHVCVSEYLSAYFKGSES